jgi:hypothetical protein
VKLCAVAGRGRALALHHSRFRRTFGGSSGGTWFVNFRRGWTLRDVYRFLHLGEMPCVDVTSRMQALPLEGAVGVEFGAPKAGSYVPSRR